MSSTIKPNKKVVPLNHIVLRRAENERKGRKGSVTIAARERDSNDEFKPNDEPLCAGHSNKVISDKSKLHYNMLKYGSAHFINICYYTMIDDAIVAPIHSKDPPVYTNLNFIKSQIKKNGFVTFGDSELQYWTWRTDGLKKRGHVCPYDNHPEWVLWPCKKTYPTLQKQLDVLSTPDAKFVLLDIETAHKTCFMPVYGYLASLTPTYQKISKLMNEQRTCIQIVFEDGPRPGIPITKKYIESLAINVDRGLDFGYALAIRLVGGMEFFVKTYVAHRHRASVRTLTSSTTTSTTALPQAPIPADTECTYVKEA